MPQDLYAAYNSLSVARKQEVYDFVMKLSKTENKEKKQNPRNKFFGSLAGKMSVKFSDDWEMTDEEFLGL